MNGLLVTARVQGESQSVLNGMHGVAIGCEVFAKVF